jgi:hypothetical protein
MKKGVPAKVRRLLAHADGFEVPPTVEVGGRSLSMLASSIATMRLHAHEAVQADAGTRATVDSIFKKPKHGGLLGKAMALKAGGGAPADGAPSDGDGGGGSGPSSEPEKSTTQQLLDMLVDLETELSERVHFVLPAPPTPVATPAKESKGGEREKSQRGKLGVASPLALASRSLFSSLSPSSKQKADTPSFRKREEAETQV